MGRSRSLVAICVLYAGFLSGSAQADAPPSQLAVNWVAADMMTSIRGARTLPEAREKALYDFRRRFPGNLDKSDPHAVQLRARNVHWWLAADLNGDGQVTRAEVEKIYWPIARMSVSHNDPAAGPLEEQARRKLEEMIAGSMRADANSDDVVTLREVLAMPDERQSSAAPLPEFLDSNGDGVVRPQEYLDVVDVVLSTVDRDGDGEISSQESREFTFTAMRLKQQIRQADDQRKELESARATAEQCGFPEAPPDAQIVLLESSSGTGLSTVGLGDAAAMVRVGDVRVEPGEKPLYVVLYSLFPMIWRFDGATERVAQVVAGIAGPPQTGVVRAGVTGLPAERVFILARYECARFIAGTDVPGARLVTEKLGHVFDRPVTKTLVIRSLNRALVPSGTFENGVTLPGAIEIPAGTPGAKMWEAVPSHHPGGVLQIDPATVASRAEPMLYQVLPGPAGLAQLADRGAIEVLETRHYVLGTASGAARLETPIRIRVHEKIRLPWLMHGYNDLVIELAPGVPAPDHLPHNVTVAPSGG